ncbi:cytoplasmic protein NCK2-like isoform X1 [Mytilus galloprovincialis]|uniref:cytoplasmic protein NCK2-like isoform X1 n=1 Tax=Mytilus galloprovincialis TaxID=29158 RepID=UPI003F7CCEA4
MHGDKKKCDVKHNVRMPAATMNEEGQQVVVAKYDYKAENAQELDIRKHEKLVLLDDTREWWKVQNNRNKSGFVPSNYVKKSKPSKIFSSLRATLGRRNKSDTKLTSHSPVVSRNGDTGSDQNSTSSDVTICDPQPSIVKFNYTPQRPDELGLTKAEQVTVLEKSIDGWWKGRKKDNSTGWFPSNYVDIIEQNENSCPVEYSTAAMLEPRIQEQETVVALYAFTGTQPEELAFEKGERLVILEKPSEDPDWWRAQNERGLVGLVPQNYVQVVLEDCETANSHSSSTPQSQSTSSLSNTSNLSVVGPGSRKQFRVSGPLADKDWYYGKITRQECEELLKKFAQEGDFIIRDSESASGNFTVVLKAAERNKHFRVNVNDEQYQIGQQKFSSLDHLIEHYKKHPIFKQENEKLYLVKPFIMPSEF